MTNEHNNAAKTDWRELCRRLYVELWHCDKQMTSGARPKWKQGPAVRDVLRDANLALEATPAAAPAPASSQDEPFGYFRAEPFGWTDCAATDEGAIALYERPAAPAVPQREPEAYMVYGNYTRQPFRSIESAQSYMGGLLKSDPEGGYHIRPLFYATPAAPSQTVACGLCQGSGVLGPTQKCICQYGGQEPVALTNGLIEKGAMTGMVDAQIDAIIAALREKEKSQ